MKTLIRLLLLLATFTLVSCGGNNQPQLHRSAAVETAPWIEKGALFAGQPSEGAESTPIVWNNELFYVIDYIDAGGVHTRITRESDHSTISDRITGLAFVSAIVNNGTLYIFGSNSTNGGSKINMVSTTDLVNWTPKQTVFIVPNVQLFNNSVSASPAGFVMAYEICESGQVCFNVRFLQSPDLIHWAGIGGTYERDYYTACPTVRYVDGFYYLFYLSSYDNFYAVNVSRSTDLVAWQFSPITVLSPLDGDDNHSNASDIDMVEFNGQVRIIYYNGSQDGSLNPAVGLREALFNGSLSEFVSKFF